MAVASANEKPADLTHLSLEELSELRIDSVYGASKQEQKTTEAPASITIITAEEIRKFGYRNFSDILAQVRGFYVTNDRNYSYIGVRGFARPGDYSTRILMLIDGHRINDNIFDAATPGTDFPLDIDLIEKVEIIRGPSSSLYGTSAFFAVINVVTKRGASDQGVSLSGELASFGTYKSSLAYGGRMKNGLEVLFSGTHYESQGPMHLYFPEFDSVATNRGIAENSDSDRFGDFFGKISYRGFTLQAVRGSRTKSIPTASFGTVFNDSRNQTIDKHSYIDLQFEHPVGRGWNFSSRVYYDYYGYDGSYVYDYSETHEPLLVLNQDLTRGHWWGGEARFSKKLKERHSLILGSEFRDNLRQDMFNYDVEPFYPYLDEQRDSKIYALFVQDEIKLHRKILFNAGVRYDHYETFGGTTNPRLGLIYSPREKTAIKLLYGQAFRAPNTYELFWGQTSIAKANPRLGPESIRTSELVFEHHLGKHLRFATSGFLYRIGGLITQQVDPLDELLVYSNVDRIGAKGLELELEAKLPSGLRGRVSYAFQDSKNLQDSVALSNSPKHLAQLNISAPLIREQLFTSISLLYMSKRRTLGGNEAGDYLLPNLTVSSGRLLRGFELSAGVYNLFNQQYGDPGSEEHRQDIIQQNGRTFRVKLTYRIRPGQ
jgi:iron complex outermembrane receptor protein